MSRGDGGALALAAAPGLPVRLIEILEGANLRVEMFVGFDHG